MKLKFWLVSLLVLLATMSCASMKGREMSMADYDIQNDRDKAIPGVSVRVTDVGWGNNWLYGTEGISGIKILVDNQSDAIVKIVWEESSISYNGKSFPVFLDGMKYTNAGQVSAPPTIVGKGQTASREVYSSDQPFYVSGQYGGWQMGFMAHDVQLVLCVTKGDEKAYEIISIKAKLKPLS